MNILFRKRLRTQNVFLSHFSELNKVKIKNQIKVNHMIREHFIFVWVHIQ